MLLWSRYQDLSHAAKSALIVVCTVLLIAVAIIAAYFMVIHASDSATAAKAIASAARTDQHNLCLATNKEDAKQILLWQYLLRLAPPQNQQQVQLDQQFEAFLNEVFKPAVC